MLILALFLLNALGRGGRVGCPDDHPESLRYIVDWKAWERGDLLLTTCKEVEFVPEIGNGYIATVVGSDTLFAAGVFNGYSTADVPKLSVKQLSHRAHVPAPLALDVAFGAQASGSFIGAALDLRHATYSMYYTVNQLGTPANVELQFFAHRARRSLLIAHMSITSAEEAMITVDIFRKTPFPAHQGDGDKDFIWKITEIHDGEFEASPVILFVGQTALPEIPTQPLTKVAVIFPAEAAIGTKSLKTSRVSSASGGQARAQLQWIAAIRTSLDSAKPEEDAKSEYLQATRATHEQLYAEHTSSWAELWKSGFEVTGRVDVARAVNSSLYYILSSLREDAVHSLSPGGLASNGYFGHSFWDCETWIYPSLVLWHPNLARSLLQYRAERVDQSESKAKSYAQGWSGAMFAWESGATGAEVCPPWADTWLYEHHITGDIAFALQQYWYATRNRSALQELYPQLLKRTADFWVSRVRWDEERKVAHIAKVIPPDEYTMGDDSVYTNYVAHRNLALAEELAPIVNEQADPSWRKVAAAIPILFDQKRGVHPEYAGYHGSQIKQADITLLGYPLMMPMAPEVQRNDLEYYAPLTDQFGPAMTWAMHAVGYMVLRDKDKASRNFDAAFANTQLPYYVWTETPNGGAKNFITGAGGFLQAVLFGLPGIRIWEDHLDIDPWLGGVQGIESFLVRGIHYRNSMFTLSADSNMGGSLTLRVESGHGIAVTSQTSSKETLVIEPGQTKTLPLGRLQVRDLSSISAVPEGNASTSDPAKPLMVTWSIGQSNETRTRSFWTVELQRCRSPFKCSGKFIVVITLFLAITGSTCACCCTHCSKRRLSGRSSDRNLTTEFPSRLGIVGSKDHGFQIIGVSSPFWG